MYPKLQIEYNQQGHYGLIDGEPIVSQQHHVIYAPNPSLIQLLYEEICELKDKQVNPNDGVIFRMISRAIDAYRNKITSSSIKDLLEKDYYLKIQSKLSQATEVLIYFLLSLIF